jgi:predicted MPP superfamily phosphohydrolase
MWLASFSSFEEMGRAMLVAQISDLHVRPDGCLYEGKIPSNAMAMAAVNHLNSLKPRPELVLITGDIVDGGIAEEYEMSRRILAPLEIPYLVIPETTTSGVLSHGRLRTTPICLVGTAH